ncbi:MAG: type IV secretory system conjugative DNA transfer family protein [Planctomycetota bacterium]
MSEIGWWDEQGPEDDGPGDKAGHHRGDDRSQTPDKDEAAGSGRKSAGDGKGQTDPLPRSSAEELAESGSESQSGELPASPRKSQDLGWIYDPTSCDMLRSDQGTDRPPQSPFEYVSGARHPVLGDLQRYLQDFESGSLELPATVPLLRVAGHPVMQREPHYGLSLVWQSRERSTPAVVVGKSGGGKNTRFIDLTRYSALCDRSQTVISVSLKSSDYGPIATACERVGKRCLVVNFADDWRSVGFNPLRTASKNEAPDIIRRLAESSRNPRSGDSEFWTQMFRTGLLALFEGGYRNFPEMFRFYSQSRKAMVQGLEQLDNAHARKMADFLGGGSWNADTTEATIVGAFVAFQQESIQRVMSRDELQLDELFKQPVCLQIEVDEATLETALPLVQMLMRCIVDKLIATAQRLGESAVPATIFVDDLPSLGPVFSVERLLTLRSRKIAVVAGCQSIAALYQAFPHSGPAVLEAFGNQIVLPGCSQEDAEYFSRASGQQLVRQSGGSGHANQYLTLPLLSPTDIRSPEYGHFLLGRPATFLLGEVVFQAYLQFSYEVPEYRQVLAAARTITGTERLRERRLPNRYRRAGKRSTREPQRKKPPVQLKFPFHFTADDVRDWSDEDLIRGIRQGLDQLGYESAFSWVKSWWDAYLTENRERLRGLLRLVSELIEIKSNVAEYYYTMKEHPEFDPEVMIAYLRFSKKLDASKSRRRNGKSKDEAKGEPKDGPRASRKKSGDEGRKGTRGSSQAAGDLSGEGESNVPF